jgi:hypothetical protein
MPPPIAIRVRHRAARSVMGTLIEYSGGLEHGEFPFSYIVPWTRRTVRISQHFLSDKVPAANLVPVFRNLPNHTPSRPDTLR